MPSAFDSVTLTPSFSAAYPSAGFNAGPAVACSAAALGWECSGESRESHCCVVVVADLVAFRGLELPCCCRP